MTTEIAVREEQEVELTGGSVFMSSRKFDYAWRIAKALSASQFIPANFRNKPEDCLIALDLAARLNMPPTMLLQNCYVVHGRVGMESKFLIALFNATGKYSPMAYIYEGQKGTDSYSCHAEAKHMESGMMIKVAAVTQAMVRAEGWGSKWKSMPEVMYPYRAAAFFIRLHAPELAMGMYTKDELEDMPSPEAPSKVKSVAKQVDYIEAESVPVETETPTPKAPIKEAPKTSNYEFLKAMKELKATVGEEAYYAALTPYKHSNEILKREDQTRIYLALKAIAETQRADAEVPVVDPMPAPGMSVEEPAPEPEQESKHKYISCPDGNKKNTKICESKCPMMTRDYCQAYIDWYTDN